MNRKLICKLLGKVLMVGGIAMLPSVLVALLYHGKDWWPLLFAAALAFTSGTLLRTCIHPENENLRPKEGFLTVALCWVVLSFFGCLPFYIGGYIPRFADAFFECVSGFTTTGATILTNVEALPKGILFWRSFTHWIGGMGVLVLMMAVMPKTGANTLYLLKAESTGPAPGKLVPKMGKTAKLLYIFYLAFTVAQIIAYLCCGMNLYDALIHAFGTAGTGGFSSYTESIGHFRSAAVENVTSIFLLLFSVNFSLYYLLWHRDFKNVLHNEELLTFLGIVACSVLLIAVNILPIYGTFWTALRYALFQVSSIISTAGFGTADFNQWPQFSKMILLILMLVGACAGSTGGGIKVIRASLLVKNVKRELQTAMHPRSVSVVRMQGKSMDEGTLHQVTAFFFSYVLILLVATLLVSLDNFDFETNFTSVLSALSNIGPGLSLVGPAGNFAMFSDRSKYILSLCMLIGRLEIYPMLLLFSPIGWKRG